VDKEELFINGTEREQARQCRCFHQFRKVSLGGRLFALNKIELVGASSHIVEGVDQR